MSRYIIKIPEVFVVYYAVDADSPEQAFEKVRDDGDVVLGSRVISDDPEDTLEPSDHAWVVEDLFGKETIFKE